MHHDYWHDSLRLAVPYKLLEPVAHVLEMSVHCDIYARMHVVVGDGVACYVPIFKYGQLIAYRERLPALVVVGRLGIEASHYLVFCIFGHGYFPV